jgi:hypothetical protein
MSENAFCSLPTECILCVSYDSKDKKFWEELIAYDTDRRENEYIEVGGHTGT